MNFDQLPIDTIRIILRMANVSAWPSKKRPLIEYGYFKNQNTRQIERIFNFYDFDAGFWNQYQCFTGAISCIFDSIHHDVNRREHILWTAQRVEKIVFKITGYEEALEQLSLTWPKNVRFIIDMQLYGIDDHALKLDELILHEQTEKIIIGLGHSSMQFQRIVYKTLFRKDVQLVKEKIEVYLDHLPYPYNTVDQSLPMNRAEFWKIVGPYVTRVGVNFEKWWTPEFVAQSVLPNFTNEKILHLEMPFVLYTEANNLWNLLNAKKIVIGGSNGNMYHIRSYKPWFIAGAAENSKVQSIVVDYKHMNIPKLDVKGVIFESVGFQRNTEQEWMCAKYEVQKGWDNERLESVDKYDTVEVQRAVDFLETIMN